MHTNYFSDELLWNVLGISFDDDEERYGNSSSDDYGSGIRDPLYDFVDENSTRLHEFNFSAQRQTGKRISTVSLVCLYVLHTYIFISPYGMHSSILQSYKISTNKNAHRKHIYTKHN